jgi:hypothetical protein
MPDKRLESLVIRLTELLMTMTMAATLMMLDRRNPEGWGKWKKQAEALFQEVAALNLKTEEPYA